MRICRRRRTGFLATVLLIWQLLDTVYGIPAYTSYAETWRSWVKVMGVQHVCPAIVGRGRLKSSYFHLRPLVAATFGQPTLRPH